jgi:hypothetical protein
LEDSNIFAKQKLRTENCSGHKTNLRFSTDLLGDNTIVGLNPLAFFLVADTVHNTVGNISSALAQPDNTIEDFAKLNKIFANSFLFTFVIDCSTEKHRNVKLGSVASKFPSNTVVLPKEIV